MGDFCRCPGCGSCEASRAAPRLRAEIDRLRRERAICADESADGTDGACIAWWRGQEDGARGIMARVEAVLGGEPVRGGSAIHGTLRRVEALRARIAKLEAVAEAAVVVAHYIDHPLCTMPHDVIAALETIDTFHEGEE